MGLDSPDLLPSLMLEILLNKYNSDITMPLSRVAYLV